jgi:hypothetical protein
MATRSAQTGFRDRAGDRLALRPEPARLAEPLGCCLALALLSSLAGGSEADRIRRRCRVVASMSAFTTPRTVEGRKAFFEAPNRGARLIG